ncbi:3-oxoacyl-ACP reductase [Echinicola strongylocentroti]|uniref:3-oxoacyl-ACP reductase n=1 Tax=Echinicola strongylocentroti TaxID=1795355 RepID=A0A2Z4IJR0_9BACT|nr:SDR family oxidoreductase [Echinicola strongylocentroti]AWW31371.1 3-oxoacyl-ACP reductase [Echinicola strongylocentroti]
MNLTKTNRPVAIVTGGASGLGLATSKKLCGNDITTVIIGRNKTKLIEAQKELGSNCHYYVFDLNDLNNIPALINSIIAEHGKIDILVNNAGINMKKPFIEVTDEEFQQIITTNVSAVFSLSREVAKIMADQKSGAIVNISSMASQYGIPKVIAYTASKSAIEGMTKAMAVELSPLGIRVNCVAPGFIATEMSAKALDGDPERKQKVLSRTPMGTLGNPEHIADAVYYLTSESAGYVTGTVLPVDGGNSIGF